jgi:hypothetical protein
MATNWSGEWTLLDFFNKSFNEGMYPPPQHLIDSQIDFSKHILSKPKNLLSRTFSPLSVRGRVYPLELKLVATSDNEACCGFYQEIYKTPWKAQDLFTWFKNSKIGISARIDESDHTNKSKLASEFGLIGTQNHGNPFRSEHDLKLSHYLAAAEKLSATDPIELRAARFLSPLNICLTPKTRRKERGYVHTVLNGPLKRLFKNDLGETDYYLHILHALLVDKVIAHPRGIEAYQAYIQICRPPFILNEEMIKNAKDQARDIVIRFERPQAQLDDVKIPIPSKQNGVLRIGSLYTKNEVKDVLGGTIQKAINTKDGRATWAAFTCGKGYNPEGPGILGIHGGEGRESGILSWLKTGAVPFFFNDGNNKGKFEFMGSANLEIICRSAEAQSYARARNYPTPEEIEFIVSVTLSEESEID